MSEFDMTTVRYKLVGPNAGRTVVLGKQFGFVNGVMEVQVREDQVDKLKGLTRQLGRSYNAHPEGSKALAEAEKQWEQVKPKKGAKPAPAKEEKNEKGPKVQDREEETDGDDADGGSGDGSEDGSEGHETDSGDGDDSGDDEGSDDTEEMTLEEGLRQLDPKNGAHWTSTGHANLKAIGDIMGRGVTRGEIEEAIPGFNRKMAKAAA